MSEKTVRCTDCAAEFTHEELEGANGCPICKTSSLPCRIEDDVTLNINWHELRILAIWASNYAGEKLKGQPGERTLRSIIKRLHAQHPERTPLTFADEIQQVANHFGDAEIVSSDGTRTVVKQNKPS